MCRGNIGKWQPSPRRVNKDTEDHSSGSRQRSGGAILALLERLGHHGCVRLSLERPERQAEEAEAHTRGRTSFFLYFRDHRCIAL